MNSVNIYQTLENRKNKTFVEKNGPFLCSVLDSNGNCKKGIKTPWLGEGYYFWDSRIEDALWWGDTVYNGNYIICKTTYDQHSSLLYDMVGNVQQFDDFEKCANLIRSKLNKRNITFLFVLKYLKIHGNFNYKAIRVWPSPNKVTRTFIQFPDNKLILGKLNRIQLCFFDKTMLTEPYSVVKEQVFTANQTI